MADSLNKAARDAAAKMIIAKRDQLLAERRILMAQRAETLAQLRRNDREFSDCRSAARLFGLEIEFPPDEQEEAERQYLARREAREREIAMREAAARNAAVHGGAVVMRHAQMGQFIEGNAVREIAPPSKPSVPPKPSNRELVLQQLQRAGAAGSRAAPIREFIERTYNYILHEKTVGMTLYRLSREGLVRREGQTWFFVPQSAETKNPGADTPGLSKSAD